MASVEQRASQDRVGLVMSDIADYIANISDPQVSRNLRHLAEDAAKCLVEEHSSESNETIATTLRRLLPRLQAPQIKAFFSYKDRDKATANEIAKRLEAWSDGKLSIAHMGYLGGEQVGRNWREWIERAMQECDWFLMLLPTPQNDTDWENDRDWVVFEAGYFCRGQGLAGRLVCLHHPETKVTDALEALQSVPAKVESIKKFLRQLFLRSNWIPGRPALNPDLNELENKAKEIVNLIRPPKGPGKKFCCGAHMEVAFDDASAVKGWEQLAAGWVRESNDECRRLFGLDISRHLFGDWARELAGNERNRECLEELALAVQAVGVGRQPPRINASFCVGGRSVQPRICAVSRRGDRVESVDILFNDAGLPSVFNSMKPDLAALAITLDYAVRFRYQVLEHFADRKLDSRDVLRFNGAMMALSREFVRDRRIVEDPLEIRRRVLKSFVDEDNDVVKEMYGKWDQLQRSDFEGEMDRAIANLQIDALEGQVRELLDINQRFLTLTSKRFAELIASS